MVFDVKDAVTRLSAARRVAVATGQSVPVAADTLAALTESIRAMDAYVTTMQGKDGKAPSGDHL